MRDWIIREIQSADGCDATWRIARRMRLAATQVRRELLRMERDGLVERTPHSTANNIVWRLLPANAGIEPNRPR